MDESRAEPALLRFRSLSTPSSSQESKIRDICQTATRYPVQRRLDHWGQHERVLVTGGWAALRFGLPSGRVQIVHLALPGDVMRRSASPDYQWYALSPLTVSAIASAADAALLDPLFRASDDVDRQHAMRHMVRLGRMSAEERLFDALIELEDRLAIVGLTRDSGFLLPMTQEQLGDYLALTAVHMNRTIRNLRGAGRVEWSQGRMVTIHASPRSAF